MLYPLTILRHIEMKRQASPGGRGTNDQMLSMFSVFALTTEQAITSINPSTSSLVFHSVTPVFHDNFVYGPKPNPCVGTYAGTVAGMAKCFGRGLDVEKGSGCHLLYDDRALRSGEFRSCPAQVPEE